LFKHRPFLLLNEKDAVEFKISVDLFFCVDGRRINYNQTSWNDNQGDGEIEFKTWDVETEVVAPYEDWW
jgi:hypothetical protein